MQHVSVIRQYISHLKVKPGLSLLIPAMMAVLVTGCSMFKKDEAREAERALERALNPPTAARSDDPAAARSPEEAAFKGVAGSRMNRDINGQSLSLVVRVIQLRDRNEFARLTFEGAVNKSEQDLFPKELVSMKEVQLMPGTTQEFTDKLLPETKYVGLIGFFHHPNPRFWRLLFAANAVRKEGLNFVAHDCYFVPLTPRSEPLPGQTASYDALSCPLGSGQPRSGR